MAKRVLLVDDNPAMVGMLSDALLRAGFRVLAAENGEEGLRLVKEEQPDLVLLDVMMPVMSGLQVLRAMRRNPETSGLPVIILTGRGGHEDALDGWMGGANRYLTKPCKLEDIISAVRQMLTPVAAH
jgi:DNA-binding response OmpR family regulator